MPIPRIYQAVALDLSAHIRLDEKASHHIARVLRAKIGDRLILFNGRGGEYESVICQVDKKNVEVNIDRFINREAESPLDLSLAQGVARGDKMDMIIQKSTELGVRTLIPLITERCQIKKSYIQEQKYQHWQSVAISASEQCGRNRLLIINEPMSYGEWLQEAKFGYCFVLSPHHAGHIPVNKIDINKKITLLIGPEGGLSEKEIEEEIKNHFISLNLGPRILRTETAGLAAISMFQTHIGDMKIFADSTK